LDSHSKQVKIHFQEALLDDFDGPHNPHHMLERALVLSAFCIRRMIEKRVLTDALSGKVFTIRAFPVHDQSSYRPPFNLSAGSNFHKNYDFYSPQILQLKLKNIADEIIHSSQIATVQNGASVSDGLLINSDYHLKTRLLHMTIEEFYDVVKRVLNDQVVAMKDLWDPESGKVTSERL
jgi:hypothetical protein